eukprot:CAMPEP_0204515976 /NCGR_PEP_ID=MMETSP0661-20131031/2899_1 /ASSEMBLY_ACC=CAM_ASM_000606 /TAXON_ID=109239 /ORGANISM="Alexandrium margalefi, Strain AMGDE01CS-322" /LENGTH=107 /DNA_ID=CAMNT_0051521317 /DNA_START=236 /DNA_END=555 /DNA_ORIENTATION=-
MTAEPKLNARMEPRTDTGLSSESRFFSGESSPVCPRAAAFSESSGSAPLAARAPRAGVGAALGKRPGAATKGGAAESSAATAATARQRTAANSPERARRRAMAAEPR